MRIVWPHSRCPGLEYLERRDSGLCISKLEAEADKEPAHWRPSSSPAPSPALISSTVAFSNQGQAEKLRDIVYCFCLDVGEAEDCPSSKPWQDMPFIAGCAFVWTESSSLFVPFQYKRNQVFCLVFFYFPLVILVELEYWEFHRVLFVSLLDFWFWSWGKEVFALCFLDYNIYCFHMQNFTLKAFLVPALSAEQNLVVHQTSPLCLPESRKEIFPVKGASLCWEVRRHPYQQK